MYHDYTGWVLSSHDIPNDLYYFVFLTITCASWVLNGKFLLSGAEGYYGTNKSCSPIC